MTQDRSTPLESVVERARSFARRNSDRPTTADLLTRLADRVEADRRWMSEAALALEAASVIGEREGCHLNYGNHDRLLAEYRQALSTQPHQAR